MDFKFVSLLLMLSETVCFAFTIKLLISVYETRNELNCWLVWDALAMQPTTKMIHGFVFVPIAVTRFERWTLVIACWQRRNHFTLLNNRHKESSLVQKSCYSWQRHITNTQVCIAWVRIQSIQPTIVLRTQTMWMAHWCCGSCLCMLQLPK
jgi:hypothetical protein